MRNPIPIEDTIIVIATPPTKDESEALKIFFQNNPTQQGNWPTITGALKATLTNMQLTYNLTNGLGQAVRLMLKDSVCLKLFQLGFGGYFIGRVYTLQQAYNEIPLKPYLTLKRDADYDAARLKFVSNCIRAIIEYERMKCVHTLDTPTMNEITDLIIDTKISLLVKALTVLTEVTGDFRYLN